MGGIQGLTMTERTTDRIQIIVFILLAVNAARHVFDARSASLRYLSAATVALFAAFAAWKILRYRDRYRTAR